MRLDFFHPSKTYRHDEQQKEDTFLKAKEPWEERQQCDSGEPVHLKLQYQRSGMKTTRQYVACVRSRVSFLALNLHDSFEQ